VNFVLDASLFEGSTPAHLLMLVFMASLGRHRIEVPEEALAGFRSWAQALGDLESDILEAEKLCTRDSALHPSEISVRVTSRDQSSPSRLDLSADDAVELAAKPFRIFHRQARAVLEEICEINLELLRRRESLE
jgi:hypothetical protein